MGRRIYQPSVIYSLAMRPQESKKPADVFVRLADDEAFDLLLCELVLNLRRFRMGQRPVTRPEVLREGLRVLRESLDDEIQAAQGSPLLPEGWLNEPKT